MWVQFNGCFNAALRKEMRHFEPLTCNLGSVRFKVQSLHISCYQNLVYLNNWIYCHFVRINNIEKTKTFHGRLDDLSHTWHCGYPSLLRSRPSVSRSWTRSWRGYPRCPSEITEAPWRTCMPFTSPTATRGGSIISNRLTKAKGPNLISSKWNPFNPTHDNVHIWYNSIIILHSYFFPVQDVPARPEGRVLVCQPSHWPAHSVCPYSEGRPKLQPVPGGVGAGTGAARLNPDIITIVKQQQEKKG